MRALILFLLLANVAFIAWARLYPHQASADAGLIQQQMNRDAVQLLKAPAAAAPNADATPDSSAALTTSTALSVGSGSTCLEWGAVPIADLSRAEDALAPLRLGDRLTERRSEESASWWVFIPPVPSRPLAVQKAAELKRLGVDEYFIIADESKTRFSISLGIFHSEDAAKKRLSELRDQGVRTAQYGKRDTPLTRVYFQVRNPAAAESAKLMGLRDDFSGSDVKDCSAPGLQSAKASVPGASAPASAAAASNTASTAAASTPARSLAAPATVPAAAKAAPTR